MPLTCFTADATREIDEVSDRPLSVQESEMHTASDEEGRAEDYTQCYPEPQLLRGKIRESDASHQYGSMQDRLQKEREYSEVAANEPGRQIR